MRKPVIARLVQLARGGRRGIRLSPRLPEGACLAQAAAKVREILGEDGSLASVASWADDDRGLHPQVPGLAF